MRCSTRAISVRAALALGLSLLAAFANQAWAAAPTIIRFISWNPDHPYVWEAAIQRFQAQHPEIRIVRELAPHSSTAYHDLVTQKLKNRDGSVDVLFMDVVWVPEFAAAGWVRPLDDRFVPSRQREFFPSTIDVGRYRDHLYGVPSRIDAGLLYYRADLLQKYGLSPPRTWAELVEQSEQILTGERRTTPGLRGYSAQFKQYEGLVCNMLELISSHGGTVIDPAQGRARLSDPHTLAALDFVRTRLLGPVASRALLVYQEPESLAAFVRGQAVFHRNWPYAYEIANDPERSSIAGHVGVTALPGTAHAPGQATLGGWLLAISAQSAHVDEAWAFIAFLTSADMQRVFAQRAGIAPSRMALYSDPALAAANPHWKHHAAILETALTRPHSPVYPAISRVLQRFFSRALASPDRALEADAAEADRSINRLLRLSDHQPS